VTRQEIEDRVAEYVELAELGRSVDPSTFASRFPRIERELLATLEALQEADRRLGSPSDQVPERVGNYRVLGLIGHGGMGSVLRVAAPDGSGRRFALKLLHPSVALDPRGTERFRREGRALQALRHPNIVEIHEIGWLGATPFLVMTELEGASLAQWIQAARTGTPSPGAAPASPRSTALELPGEGSVPLRAARIVAQLARAIDHVHGAGALHRDIKPANVIIQRDGTPVLIDFGLVHWCTSVSLTRTGDLLGTPQYMSPEQARGEAVDQRSDVYGLGALLYELLCLEPVHEGADAVRVLESVRGRQIRPLAARDPVLPRELCTIVHRAVAFRPGRRHASAGELADDLERFCQGRPIASRGPGLVERLDRLWTFQRPTLVATAVGILLAGWIYGALSRRIAARGLSARAAFDRALQAFADQRAQEAASAARAALELDAGHAWAGLLEAIASGRTPEPAPDPARRFAAEGWARHESEDHEGAVAAFGRSVEHAPGEPLPVVLLALESAHAGDHGRARRHLAAAAQVLPRSARLLEELGRAHYEEGDFAAAESSLTSSLELAPDRPGPWELIARSRFRLGRNAAGLEAVERAASLDGEAPSARILMTHGVLLDVHGRRTEAREKFELAGRLLPESPGPQMSLAMSLDSDHRFLEAEDAYWQAAQIGPPAKALMCLAWLYAGSNSEGCEDCRRYFDLNSGLVDPDRAEACALSALEADGGQEPGLPATASAVAMRIDRREGIGAKLVQLKEATTEDRLIARYEKALRMLRRD
jgi:tetratricopeptide (TPR) repeat protein